MLSKEDALTLIEMAQKYPAQKPAMIQIAVEVLAEEPGGDSAKGSDQIAGLTFPLEVFCNYKGQRIKGRLFKDGTVEVNGTRMKPSPAAGIFTGNAVNGWKWWHYIDPFTGQVREIAYLRERGLLNLGS